MLYLKVIDNFFLLGCIVLSDSSFPYPTGSLQMIPGKMIKLET